MKLHWLNSDKASKLRMSSHMSIFIVKTMQKLVQVPTALAEDLSSVPSTHGRQLTYNSSSKDPIPSFWLLWEPAVMTIYPHTDTYKHIITNKKCLKNVWYRLLQRSCLCMFEGGRNLTKQKLVPKHSLVWTALQLCGFWSEFGLEFVLVETRTCKLNNVTK